MAHDTLLTVFIIIAAIAIVMQAAAVLGMFLAVRRVQKEVTGIRGEVKQRLDPLINSVTQILTDSREPLRTVLANVRETSQTVRNRAHDIDRMIDEVADKCRLQVLRVDQTLSDLLYKIQNTGTVIQRNMILPVQEVSAVMKGLRAGMDFFLSRRRESQTREAPQDEQMFI